jgi:tRNA1Val (adenine37-N6)-methyltransferase
VDFAKGELTQDQFLGGKLSIWQPKKGYRAGADPVFLAASVAASDGDTVLELGCGVGVASLCLGHRVPGLIMTGVELQRDYADLARKNAVENDIAVEVSTGDLCALPDAIRMQSFDHVLANPPYFKAEARTKAADHGRETALAGKTPLAVWVDVAIRRLKPGGSLNFIQKIDRLPELLVSLDHRVGGICVKPLAPRQERSADIVIVTARKGARAPFRLMPPLVLHDGLQHERDGESYSATARAILRDGQPLGCH